MQCERCSGTGVKKLVRCQSFYYKPWMTEFFEAYEMAEGGLLPDEGGWTDQTADFVNVYRAIKGQLAESRAQEARAKEKLAKQAKGKK